MKKQLFASLLCLLLLSGCGGKPEMLPLEELSEDYSLEQAKEDGCLVTEDGIVTSGRDAWEKFLKAADAGKSASVRLCTYYTLDDPSRYDPDYYESIKDDYPCCSSATCPLTVRRTPSPACRTARDGHRPIPI